MKNQLTLKKLEKILQDDRKKRILIISGQKSYVKSGAKKIFDRILSDANCYFYFKKYPYPDIRELKKIIIKIKEIKPRHILAIGGGAVLDLSKISNYLINSKNIKSDILRSNYIYKRRFSKLIAIPTTAGSGAEVTTNAVIYINKKKFSVENKLIRPNNYCLIPNLIKKNNFHLKSASGFDAIAQAIESLFSMKSNKKSCDFAVSSLKLSIKNFHKYLKNPNDTNSKNMIKAANLAGEAISISKTTAPHALSYPFTSHFGIDHGHAVAITFNEFLEFNYLNKNLSTSNFDIDKRFNILFKLTETQNIFELKNFFLNLEKNAGANNAKIILQ